MNMGDLSNPFRDFVASITPTEFEKYCVRILKGYAECEQLKEFAIVHNEKILVDDGEYQIDIYAEFTAIGVKFKVLGECKRYTYPIEREKVVVLADKVRSIGAQKGILISTSGFQSGAVQYAKAHGIALIQIFDKQVLHIQNSIYRCKDKLFNEILAEYYMSMPSFYAKQYDEHDFPRKNIYPTQSEVEKVQEEIMAKYKDKVFDIKNGVQ